MKQEFNAMLTKTAFGLALVLATVTGSLAATKPHASAQAAAPVRNVYSPSGANNYGTDPDPTVRFDLQRDWSHGRY
jgi:hypothetical protein